MNGLQLTAEEKELVLSILSEYQGDLNMEIADTSTPDYARALKKRAAILSSVVEKVEKSE